MADNARQILEKAIDDKGGLFALSKLHHETHEGNVYSSYAFNNSLTVAGVLNLIIQTPSTGVDVHIKNPKIQSGEAPLKCTLTEDYGAFAFAGTITSYNKNRLSSLTSDSNIFSTIISPSTTVTQLTISSFYVGGMSAGKNIPDDEEFILHRGKAYLFQLTNVGFTTTSAAIEITWYEESV